MGQQVVEDVLQSAEYRKSALNTLVGVTVETSCMRIRGGGWCDHETIEQKRRERPLP